MSSFPDTQKVARSFSAKIKQYDHASSFHKKLALALSDCIQTHSHEPKAILEIGSHNGLQTQALNQWVRHKPLWLISDIHRHAAEYTPEGTHYFIADGEHCPIVKESLDLIYSGSSFQWFKHFGSSIQQLFQILKPGGILAFSIFLKPTLEPLQHIISSSDTHQRFIELRDIEMLQSTLSTYAKLDFQIIQDTLYFDHFSNIRSFLKNMGANASQSSHIPIKPKQYREIVEQYESYRKEEGLPIQMQAAIVLLKKH